MERPTIGRIVHYTLSPQDASAITRRREPNAGHGDNWPRGAQAHVGNPVCSGEIVPAVVVWPHDNDSMTFNGQAFLDGNDTLWLTSVPYNENGAPGTWRWPQHVLS